MRFEQILYEVDGGVLTITMNRPDDLNAWTATMHAELFQAFEAADEDDEVRAIVVTGAGRAFCAGADLKVGDGTTAFREPDDGSIPRDPGGMLTLRMFESKKPMIAAINGPAAGFGATFPLAMDVRLASEEAFFAYVFTRLGAVPEACSTWFLPRIVGPGKASEWFLTGRRIPAAEALEAGLLNAVHPADRLLDEARAIAREIVERTSAVGVALTRRMIWQLLGSEHPMDAHRAESRILTLRHQAPDLPEGIAAFNERRPARFSERVSAGLPDPFPGTTPPAY